MAARLLYSRLRLGISVQLAITVLLFAGVTLGQQPATQPSAAGPSLISLNFPENVDLKTLVDYVSQRLEFNVIYQDEQLANQRVTIKSPTRIPVAALLPLLKDLLKVKGFALIDADQPGWKKVVALQASSVPATQPSAGGGDQVITQAFTLKFIDPQRADQAIKPFLSGTTAGSIGIPEQHVLLVTDFAANMRRIGQILELIDQPNRNLKIQFIAVKNADAAQVGQQVKQILLARARAQSLPGQNPDNSLEVTQDRRTGQLAVVGPASTVEEAADIVKSLDVPVSEQQSPIRFYKLANATAADVLETIAALESEPGSGNEARPAAAARQTSSTPSAAPAMQTPTLGSGPAGLSGLGAANAGIANPYGEGRTSTPPGGNIAPNGITPGAPSTEQTSPAIPPGLHTRNATVAADPNTNSIIVIAEPTVQRMYEQIIKALDKRRPQVLIEATIVSIDTTRALTLGVEFGAQTNTQPKSVTFSSFGFSTPNPSSGQLALTPGVGFNGAVISSDVATVILRALAQSNRAKVSSAPRILVNDNATGTLSSLTEQPFTTTAIGTTIATTSFGGYAQAGTTVTLTPHISESDYLQLEYQVSLSSFQGQGDPTHGIPPGIEQDSVQSKVTIPDGSTVVVGGLNRKNSVRSVQGIPVLDQIPLLGYLFSSHDNTDEQVTLFVFLRPIILRDDQFADLKFLSQRDLRDAGIPAGMPVSEPVPIR